MMRKLSLAAALALGCAMLGGCNLTTQLTAGQQTVIAIMQKVAAGAKVAAADVATASTFVCASLPKISDGLTQVRIVAGTGPKATQALTVASAALAGVAVYCNGAQGSGLQMLLGAWKGLNAAQTAINNASGAAGQ